MGVLQEAKPVGLLEPDPAVFENSPNPGSQPVSSTAPLMAPSHWFPNGIYHKMLQHRPCCWVIKVMGSLEVRSCMGAVERAQGWRLEG